MRAYILRVGSARPICRGSKRLAKTPKPILLSASNHVPRVPPVSGIWRANFSRIGPAWRFFVWRGLGNRVKRICRLRRAAKEQGWRESKPYHESRCLTPRYRRISPVPIQWPRSAIILAYNYMTVSRAVRAFERIKQKM